MCVLLFWSKSELLIPSGRILPITTPKMLRSPIFVARMLTDLISSWHLLISPCIHVQTTEPQIAPKKRNSRRVRCKNGALNGSPCYHYIKMCVNGYLKQSADFKVSHKIKSHDDRWWKGQSAATPDARTGNTRSQLVRVAPALKQWGGGCWHPTNTVP